MNKYFYEELPPSLSSEEQNKLLKECKNRNKEVEDKLLLHNTRLVAYIILKYSSYERGDLFSVGCIGLKKAIATFDYEKGKSFSTYAIKCINNEILQYLRRIKKHANVDSLDRIIRNQSCVEGNTTLANIISDKEDFTKEIENRETIMCLHQIIENLNERDRDIIEMFFGIKGVRYNQNQIAEKYKLTQSYVSRIIRRVLNTIKINLLKEDIIIDQKKK